MPLYEYLCPKCGTVFEELESVTNRDKPHACPVCGEKKGKRLVSTFSARGGASCGTNRGFT